MKAKASIETVIVAYRFQATLGGGRLRSERAIQSAHQITTKGTDTVRMMLWSKALSRFPRTNDDTARVAPHSGQSTPKIALEGQSGGPLSVGDAMATAQHATIVPTPSANGTAGCESDSANEAVGYTVVGGASPSAISSG